MKINELMIGDYICLDGDVNYDNPIRIQQIGYQGENDIVADSDVFGVEDIIPIPLTEEILVKNGFEDVTEEGDRIRLLGTFDENDNLTFVNLYPATIGYGTDIPQLKVYYVHQLQHLLRLAGVQKEIEL